MKKRLVRIISLVLCLVMVSSFASNAIAAGNCTYPKLSETNYCEFRADYPIYVYANKTCKDSERGTCSPKKYYNAYIDTGDICYIYEITSSYIKVNYPTSSGRKTGYIKHRDLGISTAPFGVYSSHGKATTFSSLHGGKYGSTAKNDTVYDCARDSWNGWNERVPIMYTAKSGNRAYKLGWVTWDGYTTIVW